MVPPPDPTTDDRGPDAVILPFPSLGVAREQSPQEPTSLRVVIGEVLRAERHRQERTIADVASTAAVSLPYLSEVERGHKEISSDLLDAVAAALGLTLLDVVERSADRLRTRMERGVPLELRAA
jgi:hypothetical protein